MQSVCKGCSRTLSAEELSRDVEGLAADNDDLLAVEELLGNNAGKTAQQVALAIDDNLVEEARSASKCPFIMSPWHPASD